MPALRLLVLALALLLVACAGKPSKPSRSGPSESPPRQNGSSATPTNPPASGGGLYAPHIRDSGPDQPADVSGLTEPTPIVEPLARYGNRSPYTVLGKSYTVLPSADGYFETGIASWYGTKFHGRPTSSFEPYDMYKFTAAHKSLPLPSYVRVTNLENGRSLIVRVNDRGPFHDDRIIDLSYAAAVRLGVDVRGTAKVEVRAITPDAATATQTPSASARASGGLRWLQVGSFADQSNANRALKKLSDAGLHGHRLQRVEVAGRTVWRAQAGPFREERELHRAEDRIRSLGLGSPQVVRD